MRELQQRKRCSDRDRAEAIRQVRYQHQHSWLKMHSLKAVPRTDLSRKRRALLKGCFRMLDGDGSGTVEPAELGLASTRTATPPPTRDAAARRSRSACAAPTRAARVAVSQ